MVGRTFLLYILNLLKMERELLQRGEHWEMLEECLCLPNWLTFFFKAGTKKLRCPFSVDNLTTTGLRASRFFPSFSYFFNFLQTLSHPQPPSLFLSLASSPSLHCLLIPHSPHPCPLLSLFLPPCGEGLCVFLSRWLNYCLPTWLKVFVWGVCWLFANLRGAFGFRRQRLGFFNTAICFSGTPPAFIH